MLLNLTLTLGVRSFLDVGCSHGFTVQFLWQHGMLASGTDISIAAIEMAKKARGEPADRCIPPCFAAAPATRLPWPNRSFDAIVSSDVLEHLPPQDVFRTVTELSRVATRAVVLKVAVRDDTIAPGNVTYKGAVMTLPRSLHPTLHHPSWWHAVFRRVDPAWQFYHRIPSKAWWTCCSFVLVRALDHNGADRSAAS